MSAVQVSQLADIAKRSGMRVTTYNDRASLHWLITLPTHVSHFVVNPDGTVTQEKKERT